jgi:hypothetical protein
MVAYLSLPGRGRLASRARRQAEYDRRHPVHYIKDELFRNHLKPEEPPAIGEFLRGLAGQYQPIEGLKLNMGEIRKLNKALAVLEAEPEDGHFALEDEDFQVLRRVAITFIESSNLARSAPLLEDVLNDAPTEKPDPAKVIDIGTG